MNNKLQERYQYIFEEKLLEEISSIGQYRSIEKDFPMMDIGDEITHVPLILKGTIRIMGQDDKENEILLYYLEMGDSCAMTMTCCMGGKKVISRQ